MKEITQRGDIILFIDELHNLVGAGAAEGAIDAASILKPACPRRAADRGRHHARRVPQVPGARLRAGAPLPEDQRGRAHQEETEQILRGLRDRYEAHHRVTITDEALAAAANLADRYISDRFLPDKAIDLIDEASSRMRIKTMTAPPPTASSRRRSTRSARRRRRPSRRRSSRRPRTCATRSGASPTRSASSRSSGRATRAARGPPSARRRSPTSSRCGPASRCSSSPRPRRSAPDGGGAPRAGHRPRAGDHRGLARDPPRPGRHQGPQAAPGRSSSSAPRASGRPSWRGRWPSSCSATRARSSRSTCPSTWRGTRCRGCRLAPGLHRLRRGRPAHRAGAPQAVLGDPARRGREGAPEVFNILLQVLEDGRLTDGQGRSVDFRNADPDHDLEHRSRASRSSRSGSRRRRRPGCRTTT